MSMTCARVQGQQQQGRRVCLGGGVSGRVKQGTPGLEVAHAWMPMCSVRMLGQQGRHLGYGMHVTGGAVTGGAVTG